MKSYFYQGIKEGIIYALVAGTILLIISLLVEQHLMDAIIMLGLIGYCILFLGYKWPIIGILEMLALGIFILLPIDSWDIEWRTYATLYSLKSAIFPIVLATIGGFVSTVFQKLWNRLQRNPEIIGAFVGLIIGIASDSYINGHPPPMLSVLYPIALGITSKCRGRKLATTQTFVGNKNGLKVVFILIAAGLFVQPASASGWIMYHESAFKGKVIDAETNKPIDGAAVLAIFNVMQYFMGPDAGEVFSDVKEVVTDANGEFYIPSHTWIHLYPFAKKGITDFLIFKPGYCVFPSPLYFKIYPESNLRVDASTMEELFRKGVTIKLPKLKTKKERLQNLPSPAGERNDWKKQKWFIQLINEDGKDLGLEEAYKN